jgi:hypothetical protein
MRAPCHYIRLFFQLPHVNSGAFELRFSHRSHLRDPNSLTFTMVLLDFHFNLEPRGALLGTPGAGTHLLSTSLPQLLYICFISKICFMSGIWFECAGPHLRPPSGCQSWNLVAPPGIYSKLAYHSTLCSQLHFPIIPSSSHPQLPTPGFAVPSPPLHSGTTIW